MNSRLPAIGLALASVIPVVAGVVRGATIALEGAWGFEFAAEHVDRLPLFLHVVASGVFYPLCALQVLSRFRAKHPVWHRRAGGTAIVAGFVAALSATWMSYAHTQISGPILLTGRMLVGPLWTLFLVLGVVSLVRRDFAAHGAWMIRAFAAAMPAGTLVFLTIPFWIAIGTTLPEWLDDSIQAGAWILHLTVAELLIRRARIERRSQVAIAIATGDHDELARIAHGGATAARP